MISVVILTKNSEKTLYETLSSIKEFNEVIALDTGSTDATLDIIKKFKNTILYHSTFTGFGNLRNFAAEKAKNDWILALDSDEVLSTPLLEELQNINLNDECVYAFPFHNFYNGKWIKWCGWYPESHIRLYNRKKTGFDTALLHESVMKKDLKTIKFKNPILHCPYQSIDDFLRKAQIYSSLFARQHKGKKKSSLTIALSHAFFAFFKSYFLKRGCLGGKEGFIISWYIGHSSFCKYLKLWEENDSYSNVSSNK